MPFRSRMGMTLVAALIAGASFVLLPTAPAWASFTSCNNQTHSFNTCEHVEGVSVYVDYIRGWTTNDYPDGSGTATNLHIEIVNPSGNKLMNCPSFSLAPDKTSPACTWSKFGDVPQGYYCDILWHWNGSGYDNLGGACVDVHP